MTILNEGLDFIFHFLGVTKKEYMENEIVLGKKTNSLIQNFSSWGDFVFMIVIDFTCYLCNLSIYIVSTKLFLF